MTSQSRAIVLWFCGLSGAGKSTVAEDTARRLEEEGFHVEILDGDAVRAERHRTLGYSAEDVIENNRRLAELCVEMSTACDAILVPVISPLEEGRSIARKIIGEGFHIVHCRTDVATVRRRDVKGLYARADRGEITDMIGYSQGATPFTPPVDADIIVETGVESLASCSERLFRFGRELLNGAGTPSARDSFRKR